MEKKLYWNLVHNDESVGVMLLDGALEYIKSIGNFGAYYADAECIEFALEPVWLTEEEFNNLSEA